MAVLESNDPHGAAAVAFASFQPRGHRPPASYTLYDVVGNVGGKWTSVFAANFRKANVPLPSWIKPEDDLFQNAPDSVRQEHSLHLIGPEAAGDWLEIFEQFRAAGALIVLFTDKSRDELLAGLKLYLAWFAQPSVLKITLDNGSDHLRRGLMTGVKAILLQTSVDDWAVYLAPGVEPPWPEGT